MQSTTLKRLALTAALLASGAPMLAAAAPKPAATPERTKLTYDAKTHKYCLTEPAVTGTRIDRILCRTANQWAAAGLNMPKDVMLAQK